MKVKEVRDYRSRLNTSLNESIETFEKNFILLSTGLLAFSITFIKDIVKVDEAILLFMLFFGWFFILLSIALMIYSFLSSVNGINKIWNIIDSYLLQNQLYDLETNIPNKDSHQIKLDTNKILIPLKEKLALIRFYSVIIFLVGVLLFASFVGVNLWRENDKGNLKIINKAKNEITIKTNKIDSTFQDSMIQIPLKHL